MQQTPRFRPARFALAAAVAAAFVLSAPFIGGLRSQLRASFPDEFVWIVGSIIAVLLAAALGAALVRVRERRGARYSAIAASFAVAIAFTLWHRSGRPETDVVELFHFVEYGIITYLFYRAWKPAGDLSMLVLPMLAGLVVGTCEEWLQWFIPNRVGEWADIFLNLVAIGCGLVFSLGADPPAGLTLDLQRASRRRIARLSILALLVFALFFDIVHLGYEITDEEIGTFESRYTKARLEELREEKPAEWRVRPLPLEIRRVSREDQYMTEGVVHVQERNEAWTAGDGLTAWRENQILEKYFGPVLDTPSYVSRTGHRWSAEQRADAEARARQVAATPFVSNAYPGPLYTWPQVLLWLVTGLAIGILIGLPRR